MGRNVAAFGGVSYYTCGAWRLNSNAVLNGVMSQPFGDRAAVPYFRDPVDFRIGFPYFRLGLPAPEHRVDLFATMQYVKMRINPHLAHHD